MAKKKVIYAQFKEPPSLPALGIGGDSSLAEGKKDVLMFTGIESGFLTLLKGQVEGGIPLSNVKSLVWERVNDK